MASFISDGSFIVDAPVKDPDSIIDYGVDWSAWLALDETILTSVWLVPAGLTSDSEAFTTTATAIFLSGGDVGTTYTLTNRIVTSEGRTEDRSMFIECVEK